jgi:flagellar biosynthesis component FlhA
MNKLLSGFKGMVPVLLAAAVMALLFVPIPLDGIGILMAARFWLAVLIFAFSVALADKKPLWFARAVLLFCIVALAAAVSTARYLITPKVFSEEILWGDSILFLGWDGNVALAFAAALVALATTLGFLFWRKASSFRNEELSAKYLIGTFAAFWLILAIVLLGGFVICVSKMNLSLDIAARRSVILSCNYFFLHITPFLLVGAAVAIDAVKRKKSIIS